MIHGLSLCSGIGGLELGLRAVFGSTLRVVGYVERESYAAAALVARMEEASLDRAPVWSDIETFDCAPYGNKVDLVFGGPPCQPFSVAGKRSGVKDDRWLWPHVWRIVLGTGARSLFLENVPGFGAYALPFIVESLAASGWSAEWDLFRASDVGAPHQRVRFFLLAHADGPKLWEQSRWRSGTGGASEAESRNDGAIRFPPGPDRIGEWEGPQPAVRGSADGVSAELVDRSDRFRVLGNAVVPQCAEQAFRVLAERLRAS